VEWVCSPPTVLTDFSEVEHKSNNRNKDNA